MSTDPYTQGYNFGYKEGTTESAKRIEQLEYDSNQAELLLGDQAGQIEEVELENRELREKIAGYIYKEKEQ